jgi:hypothetical protein
MANLSLFISESDIDSIEVTIKINLGAINEIIQTSEGIHEITSDHHEDNYINTLKNVRTI